MEDGKKNMERLTYFLMGSAVAAGLAFLVSPKSGRETREILATKAKEGKDFLGNQLRRGREYVMRGKEHMSEQAQDMASRAREAAREQSEKIQPTDKQEGPETISPL
ncbi:MAG: YtxH domain-containing protein [Desulfobacteraceae bacterium]|nr:MAG: YtxH domain-containing protein [Desulfobacteraceae bacterium]